MYVLTVKKRFSAAHLLNNYQGKCANLHGHTWLVEINVFGSELDDKGMLLDFGYLKGQLEKLVGDYDHRYLNELPDFHEVNPTAENMARIIFDKVKEFLPKHVSVDCVTVWESPDASAVYKEDK
ncbi:6-carboxytetrahydropterin synthase QueD [Metallumcola ferriviriculae]|uniref:6-carboxy-5,6,7,8-tetrahydropterin synthase n=1 Tax=Metallumcola ferriviriculae TaxID=3039180 RepID=A0AAU0UPJ2_9FIRM|nr:6-carboxytetrahydropterin synthase QueD [Desulfitibacteraceae bacterium MK1]